MTMPSGDPKLAESAILGEKWSRAQRSRSSADRPSSSPERTMLLISEEISGTRRTGAALMHSLFGATAARVEPLYSTVDSGSKLLTNSDSDDEELIPQVSQGKGR